MRLFSRPFPLLRSRLARYPSTAAMNLPTQARRCLPLGRSLFYLLRLAPLRHHIGAALNLRGLANHHLARRLFLCFPGGAPSFAAARHAIWRVWWQSVGADLLVPLLLGAIAADCPWMQAGEIYGACEVHLPRLSKLGSEWGRPREGPSICRD